MNSDAQIKAIFNVLPQSMRYDAYAPTIRTSHPTSAMIETIEFSLLTG